MKSKIVSFGILAVLAIVGMPFVSLAANPVSLALTVESSCAVYSDSTIHCWGNDTGSALFSNQAFNAVQLTGPGSISATSGGGLHTTFLSGGKVYGLGSNSSGQLDGATLSRSGTLSGISAISAGLVHTCALVSGRVYCWGNNNQGQTGGSSTTSAITGIGTASAISTGDSVSCAIVSGRIYCWGRNNVGAVNGTPDSTYPSPGGSGSLVPNITGASAIASGSSHNCALVSGRVYCWGDNASGQLGGSSTTTPIPGLTSVTSISAGQMHTCALSGGRAYCWGRNNWGQTGGSSTTTPVPGLYNVTAVAVGSEHSCAIADSGVSIYCWGRNQYKQTGNPSGGNEIYKLGGSAELSQSSATVADPSNPNDDFNDNLRDTAKWRVNTPNGLASTDFNAGVTVSETSQHLEIKPMANTSARSFGGYFANNSLNLTNNYAAVEVVQATNASSAGIMALSLSVDKNNFYRISLSQGTLSFQVNIAGTLTSVNMTYNATSQRWWRIRHGYSGVYEVMYYETSPNGTTWTTQNTYSRQVAVTALYAELFAGTASSVATPGTAIFDNFQVDLTALPSLAISNLADDFNDNRTNSARWSVATLGEGSNSSLVGVAETGSKLVVTPATGQTGSLYSGYVSARTWNMNGGSASVQILRSTSTSSNAQTLFEITKDALNSYRFRIQHGNLYFEAKQAGTIVSSVSIPTSVFGGWVRLRHNSVTNAIIFETSANGTTWTAQHSLSRNIDLTNVKVEMQAGTYQSESAPDYAVFDNLNVAP